MTREVIPSGSALGADIKGIDFSKPLSDDDRAFVKQAWNDHLVVRFRIIWWFVFATRICRTKIWFGWPTISAALR